MVMVENIFPHIPSDVEILTVYFGTECQFTGIWKAAIGYIISLSLKLLQKLQTKKPQDGKFLYSITE